MSNDRISKVLGNFHRTTDRSYKHISVAILSILLILLSLFVVKYRSKILNVILHPGDFAMKTFVKDKLPKIESDNMSINLNGENINIRVTAKKVIPKENDILDLISVSSIAKKKNDQSTYHITATTGKIVSGKIFTLDKDVKIKDNDGNNVKFNELIYNTINNIITGKNPILFGINNDYQYNISANIMEYHPTKQNVKLIENVVIDAINEKLKTKTHATSNIADILYNNQKILLKKNVQIEHINYKINADNVTIILQMDTKKNKKPKENQMFSSDVKEVNLSGSVVLQDENMIVESGFANYTAKDNNIVFTENVKVIDRGKTIRAHKVVYNIITKESSIVPKYNTKSLFTKDNDSRIEVVFD